MKFRNEYAFLSNMYEHLITYKGKTYSCIESAFQAQKDPSRAQQFVTLTGPVAKQVGKTVKLRSDWEQVKVQIMKELLEIKFTDSSLRKQLEAVKCPIIENNDWGDRFWGVCIGIGKNVLGNLLEEIKNKNIKGDSKMEIVLLHNDWRPANERNEKGNFKFSDKKVIDFLHLDASITHSGNRYLGFSEYGKDEKPYLIRVLDGIEKYESAKGVTVKPILIIEGYAEDNVTISYCTTDEKHKRGILSINWYDPEYDVYGWRHNHKGKRLELRKTYFGSTAGYLNEIESELIDKAEEEVGHGYVLKRTIKEWQLLEKMLPKYYGGITEYIKYNKLLESGVLFNLIREPDNNDQDLLELEGHCQRVSKGVNGSDGEIFHPSYMSYKIWVKDAGGNKITYKDLRSSLDFFHKAKSEGYLPYFYKTHREKFEGSVYMLMKGMYRR